MSHKSRSIFYIARATFFFFTFCLSGCISQGTKPVVPPPPMDKFTENILQQTIELNQKITSAKGKGWITLDTRKIKARFKIIWAAQTPNKMRMTLLDSGNPVETIISNGKYIQFLSHTGEHSPCKSDTNSKAMKKLFSVDVPVNHVAKLLLGKIPISEFNEVYPINQAPTSQYSAVVITKNKNHNFMEKLFWNNKNRIQQILMVKSSGIMINELKFDLWKSIEQYEIPTYVKIKNKQKESITLNIENIEPNIFIKSAIFELRNP